MEIIKYEMNWCEYFTPCPYIYCKSENDKVFVGSYECANCTYCLNHDTRNKRICCSFKTL